MLIGLIIILFAWFIEMPLWLSITATVISAIHILLRFLGVMLSSLDLDDWGNGYEVNLN